MSRYRLDYATALAVPPERAWEWATSVAGVSAELWPWLRMTTPPGMTSIPMEEIRPGRPLFASWLLLFGVIPIDRSLLTVIHLDPGRGFVERSPMLGMRLWQHERWIEAAAGEGRCVLHDRLTFEPRFAGPIVRLATAFLFRHRHGVLTRRLGVAAGASP